MGVPILRIGTNKAIKLIDGGLKDARRANLFIWNLMEEGPEWDQFFEGVFELNWTKTKIDSSNASGQKFIAIKQTYFKRCQGLADLCIKLHKLVQWRLMSIGKDETITPKVINSVADEAFVVIQPMLDAIELARTEGRTDLLEEFDDIESLDTKNYEKKYQAVLEAKKMREIRARAKRQQRASDESSAVIDCVLLELIKFGIEPTLARMCAEKVVDSNPKGTEVPTLFKESIILALEGKVNKGGKKVSRQQNKSLMPNYAPGDLREIGIKAEAAGISAFDAFKEAGGFEARSYPDAVQWLMSLEQI